MTNKKNPFENQDSAFKMYLQLIDASPLCIKVFDRNGKLIFLNEGGREEHGIAKHVDIAKWDWIDTVKPKYQAAVLSAFKKGLKGKSSRIELEHTDEGSTHQWCEGLITPILDKHGSISLILFNSFDITEKKRHQSSDEKLLKTATNNLEAKKVELNEINDLLIGRELRMHELKEEISQIESKRGYKQTYAS